MAYRNIARICRNDDERKHMAAGRTSRKELPAHLLWAFCHGWIDASSCTINASGPNTEDVEDDLTVIKRVAFELRVYHF